MNERENVNSNQKFQVLESIGFLGCVQLEHEKVMP